MKVLTIGGAMIDTIAIIESNRLFGLLYLYNNLHILHHVEPGALLVVRERRFQIGDGLFQVCQAGPLKLRRQKRGAENSSIS